MQRIKVAKQPRRSEGNVGGGTGMICYEFKGGTGTSSRQIKISGNHYQVAALVQANHGRREDLTILGSPVGKHLTHDPLMSLLVITYSKMSTLQSGIQNPLIPLL